MGLSKAGLRYREWLNDHVKARFNFGNEIPNFSLRTNNGVRNAVPPVELWDNIILPIRVVELVREEFGPTTLNSAFRTAAYNATLPGAGKESRHVHNNALDFRCATGNPTLWMNFLRDLRTKGFFRGGIGLYRSSGFVHVDTRGTNADW
jgi:hypothetical protein